MSGILSSWMQTPEVWNFCAFRSVWIFVPAPEKLPSLPGTEIQIIFVLCGHKLLRACLKAPTLTRYVRDAQFMRGTIPKCHPACWSVLSDECARWRIYVWVYITGRLLPSQLKYWEMPSDHCWPYRGHSSNEIRPSFSSALVQVVLCSQPSELQGFKASRATLTTQGSRQSRSPTVCRHRHFGTMSTVAKAWHEPY